MSDDVGTPKAITETQERILRAAMEIMAERGYAATPTAEIAKRANVAEGTVFKHFKTKQGLLTAVVAPLAQRFVAPLVVKDFIALLDSPYDSLEEFLRAVFRDRLAEVRKHSTIVRIALQELPYNDELRGVFRGVMTSTVVPHAVAAIQRLQARHLIVTEEPDRILRTMVSVFASYAMLRNFFAADLEWDDDKEVEAIIRLLAGGMAPR